MTARPARATPIQLWRSALWLAVASGVLQAAVAAVARYEGRLTFQGPEAIWMAPLANTVFFLGVALLSALVPARQRGATWRFLSVSAQLFLFFFAPVLLIPGMHYYSAMTLAAGAAVFTAKVVLSHAALADRILRRSLPVLVGATAMLAIGVEVSANPSWWRAGTSAAPKNKPNVLLIVLDTVRAQNLGVYGYSRKTSPNLDRFAREGVVFERAISTAPWTLPAHASLFTGRYPHDLSADWLTPLDDAHRTLAEAFAANGYKTAGFVGNLVYTMRQTGLNRGFIEYKDYPFSIATVLNSSFLARAVLRPYRSVIGDWSALVEKSAGKVNAEFLDWLGGRGSQPFFAFLNYFDAHAPDAPPNDFVPRFGDERRPPDLQSVRSPTPDQIRRATDAYDSAIAYLDEQLGVLFAGLEARGLLDNTLVIVTSDHGEQLGEHGLVYHGNSLYRPLLTVPLVFRMPARVPAGVRMPEPISLVDVPATILNIAEIAPAETAIPGRTLTSYWVRSRSDGGDPESSPILSEVSRDKGGEPWTPLARGPMRSLVANGFHYIQNGDGREELFDFDRDIQEDHDLAARPEYADALDRIRALLDRARHDERETDALTRK